jgi:hypothetical protein
MSSSSVVFLTHVGFLVTRREQACVLGWDLSSECISFNVKDVWLVGDLVFVVI